MTDVAYALESEVYSLQLSRGYLRRSFPQNFHISMTKDWTIVLGELPCDKILQSLSTCPWRQVVTALEQAKGTVRKRAA